MVYVLWLLFANVSRLCVISHFQGLTFCVTHTHTQRDRAVSISNESDIRAPQLTQVFNILPLGLRDSSSQHRRSSAVKNLTLTKLDGERRPLSSNLMTSCERMLEHPSQNRARTSFYKNHSHGLGFSLLIKPIRKEI